MLLPLCRLCPAKGCPLLPRLLQELISSLQYNHAHGYYYDVSKARPLSAILATAAGILSDPLPIKCIEAVFLGLLLTQGWGQGELQRLPVGFKSMGPNRQVNMHKTSSAASTCKKLNSSGSSSADARRVLNLPRHNDWFMPENRQYHCTGFPGEQGDT